jgi:hypothetical protein
MPDAVAISKPLHRRVLSLLAMLLRPDSDLPRPGKGSWMLFTSTFFFFSTIGYINTLWRTQSVPNVQGVLLAAIVSGLIAVGYAYAISHRKWWLLVVPIAFHFFLATPLIFQPLYNVGWVRNVPMPSPQAMLSRHVAVWGTIIGLALGQLFMVRFIATIVRRGAADRTELAVAQRMHASIVPAVHATSHGVQIDGASDTSTRMGGDLCDIVHAPGATYAVVADVCGHGVAAGLVMAMVKGCLRTRLAQGGEPADILRDINRVMCDQLTDGSFVTLALVRVRAHQIDVALAGHPPALVVGPVSVRRIENPSLPLGIVSSEEFASTPLNLQHDETLVLYTDGLYERDDDRNLVSGAQLGLEGFALLVQEQFAAGNRTLAALMPRLRGSGTPADDQTLLLVSRVHA